MPTLEENVNRVKAAKTAIGNAITAKGGTVGANDGLEDFASDIATIPSGGGIYPEIQKNINCQPIGTKRSYKIFEPITFSGISNMQTLHLWTDGENVYYANQQSTQLVLNKETLAWSPKSWNIIIMFGNRVWTDGENIYYTNKTYSTDSYVLDKETSTWLPKTWNGLGSFEGHRVWSDGENIYYSDGSTQYVLDKETSTWLSKTWNGLSSFYGEEVWTDGENIYYSSMSTQYVLDKETSTWSTKSWSGLPSFYGRGVWTDGEDIYATTNYDIYRFNEVAKIWENTKLRASNNRQQIPFVWTDGDTIYACDDKYNTYVLKKYIIQTVNKIASTR